MINKQGKTAISRGIQNISTTKIYRHLYPYLTQLIFHVHFIGQIETVLYSIFCHIMLNSYHSIRKGDVIPLKQLDQVANSLLTQLGGKENIQTLTHCMTRLRCIVIDETKVNLTALKSIDLILDVVHHQNQLQLVVGTKVAELYEVMTPHLKQRPIHSLNKKNQTVTISYILDTISRIFTPVIGAIAGAGMIKALLALFVAGNLIDKMGQNYYILNFIGDAAFYFMPFLLALSAAKQFKCNQYLALVLAGILLHPHLVDLKTLGEPVTFLGLPLVLASYSASVVPIILITWILSFVEKLVKRYTPKSIEIFCVPMLVLLIMAPLALLLIGPLGTIAGNGLAAVFKVLDQKAGWALPIIMGMICPLLVMTGMHYSLLPIQLAQYATLGYATLMGLPMFASNMAQAAATFAIYCRTKDSSLKAIAGTSSLTALMGITEPALYGVTLRLKYPLVSAMIGGGCAGIWAGLTNVRTYVSATSGILSLPVYIGEDGLSNLFNAIICIIISITVSFSLTFIWTLKKQRQAVPSLTP